MSNLITKLPSGATLECTMASFEEADNLLTSVLHEASLINLDFGKEFEGIKTLSELNANGNILNTVKNALCQMLKSKAVKDCIFICGRRAIYTPKDSAAGVKVDRSTFESEQARQDYIEFLREVAWFNLSPFFAGMASKLKGIMGKIADTPKSTSVPSGQQ